MSVRGTLILLAGAMLCASSTLALAQRGAKAARPEAHHAAGGGEPTLLGQYGSWGAYTAAPNGKKVCFALAKPSSSKTNPPNRPRDPAYAFISSRPSEKVVNEVSIMLGYPAKPGSESTLAVGSGSYAMYTQGDGLWTGKQRTCQSPICLTSGGAGGAAGACACCASAAPEPSASSASPLNR